MALMTIMSSPSSLLLLPPCPRPQRQLCNARTMPPRHFVDPMPHHPLILLLIDPACPLDVAKRTPDVSEQHVHKPVHFKVKDSSPLLYMCHAPLCHPTTSATHTLTILRLISLIFRSIDTSPRISPENPHDRESD